MLRRWESFFWPLFTAAVFLLLWYAVVIWISPSTRACAFGPICVKFEMSQMCAGPSSSRLLLSTKSVAIGA